MLDGRPTPRDLREAQRFWESVRNHQMEIPWCTDCGQAHYYPQAVCPFCWSSNLEYRPVAGNATLHTYCVVARPPLAAFADDVPYVICIVELEEGPRMMARLRVAQGASPALDSTVALDYADIEPGLTLPEFIVVE